MDKVSRQNSKIWVYLKSEVPEENYVKKSISSLRFFLVYISPTDEQNLVSKAF
jgi:hypothetical protein